MIWLELIVLGVLLLGLRSDRAKGFGCLAVLIGLLAFLAIGVITALR